MPGQSRARGTSRARAGFTMIEVIVATLISVLVVGFMAMVQRNGSQLASQATHEDLIRTRMLRALDRAATELRPVIDTSIWEDLEDAPSGSDQLTFRGVASLDGGVVTPGPVVRLQFTAEAGEVFDDVDNDGDGLVDEGALVLIRDLGGANQRQATLCNGLREYYEGETFDNLDENGNLLIDEAGFHVERVGDQLILRLTVEGINADGRRVVESAEATLAIRN